MTPDGPEPDETEEPGSTLGPFRLGRRLGTGGMGIVYQALDTQLNRQVALKVITPQIGDDEGFRARFTREAQAQASLDSPHVVQVYSFGEADGRLYIASQLLPGGDLGQMLHRHGVPPARVALSLLSQVADGLADAHAAGLIHRDIKPANVLLRSREQALHAYLGDFGIARQVQGGQQLTQAGGVVGTPTYMAPELHTGGTAGPASDVYSLGCVLWALLSGSAPYLGSSDFQVVNGHVSGPVPQLVATGPLAGEVNRVLRTAMAKDPRARYTTATQLREDLKQVLRLPDDAVALQVPGGAGAPDPVRPPSSGAGVGSGWQLAAPRSPTPTPTPSGAPDGYGGAPPAPGFAPPRPSAPQFQSHAPAPGPRGGGSGRAGWIVAAVVITALVVIAVALTVLLASGDDQGTDGSGSGSSRGSDTDTGSGSE